MDARQTKLVFLIAVIVIILWCVSPFAGTAGQSVAIPKAALSFDGAACTRRIAEFVTRYPRRPLGSLEARQSTGFLQQTLSAMGYEVTYSHFDAVIANRIQVGRNVLAYKAGRSPEIIALIAHYDTSPTTVQGAMDDGSGVGVLLELARIFAWGGANRSLLLVASDGEEWGMLGAQDLVTSFRDRSRIVAALSLDYVAVGQLGAAELATIGQYGGYSPPWLRNLLVRASQAEGTAVVESFGIQEHLERALLFSASDQGPFLRAGIPAIDLGSGSADRAQEWAIYHSADDTVDKLRVSSVETYGRIAERAVRALVSAPELPRESMGFFKLTKNTYLTPVAIAVLQYLLFLPYLAIIYFHFSNHRAYLSLLRIQREIISFFATLIPLLLVHPCVMFLSAPGLRVLPRYTLYPGSPKYPGLEQPKWGVVAGIVITVLLCAVALYFLQRFLARKLPRPDFYVSKLILLVIFLVVIVGALKYNVYWAVSFLLLPAWAWGLIGIGKDVGGRVANRIWLLAAGIVFYAVMMICAMRLEVGSKLLWFGVLALSTGMLHVQGFLLAAAAVAVGIRFLVIQSCTSLSPQSRGRSAPTNAKHGTATAGAQHL